MNRKESIILFATSVLWVVYIVMLFLSPPSPGAVSAGIVGIKLRFLQITFAVPYLLTWIMALLGWMRVSNYAKTIAEHPDGKGFDLIAKGLFALFIGILITPFLGPLKNIFSNIAAPITVIQIFSFIWFPLIGFTFLFLGTRRLVNSVKVESGSTVLHSFLFMLPFASLYIALIVTDNCRQFSVINGCTTPTYYLSDMYILFTIAIPFLSAIWAGICAILNARKYYNGVTGTVYREMFGQWLKGFSLLIAAAIILNLLLSTGTLRLGHLALLPILAVLYIFLGVQAAGYRLIAIGAEKLRKIETVTSV